MQSLSELETYRLHACRIVFVQLRKRLIESSFLFSYRILFAFCPLKVRFRRSKSILDETKYVSFSQGKQQECNGTDLQQRL